jgi:protein arginine kinase activator
MYEKLCKTCGRSLSEFYNSGMLGCPDCYKWLGQEINDALKKIQGANFHTGKRPKINGVDKELLQELERLLREKEQAGLRGNFQLVASLSNDINDLKIELERRGLI